MQTMHHGTLSTIIATMKLKVTDKECNGTLGKHIKSRGYWAHNGQRKRSTKVNRSIL